MGVPSRKAAWIWGLASLLLGIAAFLYVQDAQLLVISLGTIFYGVPARWVDKNSAWK